MIFDRFKFYIILQVLIIAITVFLFFYTLHMEYMLITNFSLALAFIIEIVFLIYYTQKINRDINNFLNEFKFDDTAILLKDKTGNKSFQELYDTLNKVYGNFKKIKFEKERDYQYFQNAIKHAEVGLIAFDETGKIQVFNEKAKEVFGIRNIEFINELDKVEKEISNLLISHRQEGNEVINLKKSGEVIHLSLRSTKFRFNNKSIKLVSFHNIKSELEQKEIESYQKLIRILTHEIINSVSPINLVTSSLINTLEDNGEIIDPGKLSKEDLESFVTGLKAIKTRSRGLSDFVEKYRSLAKLPEPNFSLFKAINFIDNIIQLKKNEIEQFGISIEQNIEPSDLVLNGDRQMLEQVLLNLIQNSIIALEKIDNPKITIKARIIDNKKQIVVIDNGKGIPPEIMDHIFIPFFTTKEKGSGIGLSLSRQIMRLHGGTISVHSVPNERTEFKLVF